GPLPVNPGAEKCKFYMDNGKCRFGSKCKYDHPPEVLQEINAKLAHTTLGPHGLPLRPGEQGCYLFQQSG
ncbi:unnamed protein product, partial [Heterosigma akashiwo]